MSLIWNNCLSKLENEIPGSDFSTWIRPLQAIESDGKIKLLAPNRFVLDWVKEHYFTKIEETIYEFSNGTLTLCLEIGSKNSSVTAAAKIAKPAGTKKINPNFLNKAFTFDNFVEGKSNQLARAASMQVAENIGKAYNPLLIYGSSGLGKTHMMHAIGNAVLQKNPSATIVYLHSEKFVQDMVRALQQNSINAFKEFYRGVDVLLIYDIHFFYRKYRSQE